VEGHFLFKFSAYWFSPLQAKLEEIWGRAKKDEGAAFSISKMSKALLVAREKATFKFLFFQKSSEIG
jgi:hypothetical protein